MDMSKIALEDWLIERRGKNFHIPNRIKIDEEKGALYYEVPEDYESFLEDYNQFPAVREIAGEYLETFSETRNYELRGFFHRHSGDETGYTDEDNTLFD